jgi:hypothetical protein
MFKRSLVAGGARDWAWALQILDNGKRRVPLRQQNLVLDEIILAQDAERVARAAAIERLPRRQLPRLTR